MEDHVALTVGCRPSQTDFSWKFYTICQFLFVSWLLKMLTVRGEVQSYGNDTSSCMMEYDDEVKSVDKQNNFII